MVSLQLLIIRNAFAGKQHDGLNILITFLYKACSALKQVDVLIILLFQTDRNVKTKEGNKKQT